MLARRLATALAAALLAALLAAVPSAPAATIHVPAAHAAQDASDDTTQLDLGVLPDDSGSVPQDCSDATDQAAANDGSHGDLSLADGGGDPEADGSDPAAGTRARLRDGGSGADDAGADPNADPTADLTADLGSGDLSGDSGSGDGSGDNSGDPACDEATSGVFDFAVVQVTFDQALSAGAVDTGYVLFQDDGTVERELDLIRPGAPRAIAASKRASGKGKARKRGVIVLAKVERKVAKGQKVALKPKLTAAGRKALKGVKAKQVKVLVKTTFRPKHGKPRTYRKTLTLHR